MSMYMSISINMSKHWNLLKEKSVEFSENIKLDLGHET